MDLHKNRTCTYCGRPDWSGFDCCEDCSAELAARFAAGDPCPDLTESAEDFANRMGLPYVLGYGIPAPKPGQ